MELSDRDSDVVWEALTTVDPDTLNDNLAQRGMQPVTISELDALAARFPHMETEPANWAAEAVGAVLAQLEDLTPEQAVAVLGDCLAIREAQQ